jgi:hypothetical protein
VRLEEQQIPGVGDAIYFLRWSPRPLPTSRGSANGSRSATNALNARQPMNAPSVQPAFDANVGPYVPCRSSVKGGEVLERATALHRVVVMHDLAFGKTRRNRFPSVLLQPLGHLSAFESSSLRLLASRGSLRL